MILNNNQVLGAAYAPPGMVVHIVAVALDSYIASH